MTDTEPRSRPRTAFLDREGPPPRTVGAVMIGVGLFGVVASIVGVVVALQLVQQIDTSVRRSLTLTSDTLATVESSLTVAEDTLALLGDGMGQAEGTVRDLLGTLDEGERALGSIAQLTETDLANSLAAVEDSMPALIQVAAAVDASLSTLSQLPFGPPYDPDRPFDESMRSLQRSLDGLPERLREQSALIQDASGNLGEVGQGAGRVADSMAELDSGLGEALGLLQGYAATATQARELIDDTEAQMHRQTRMARVMVVVLGLVVALGQIVPLYFGWLLLRDEAPPVTHRAAGTSLRR